MFTRSVLKTLSPLFFSLSLLGGCVGGRMESVSPDHLSSINLIDRNGLSETVSQRNRIAQYDKTDFLSPQPYQKVLRVYEKSKTGEVKAIITSYHPNGQVKQYLETVNNRAKGLYREWYVNGVQKVESHVIGGLADLNTAAEQSWLFEGVSQAWDEEGNLVAEIPYQKGMMDGLACYYHKNGSLWKEIPYAKGEIHGQARYFLLDGSLLMTTDYENGGKHGHATRYWDRTRTAFHEKYENGLLLSGTYFTPQGECISQVEEGCGKRAVFGKDYLERLEEFRGGVQEGVVQLFSSKGDLLKQFSTKKGEKHGQEVVYYKGTQTPRLLLTWDHGLLQGTMKTWYENGEIESQREMSQNQKNGLLTAWYQGGALMLVEEYESDRIQKGEYYKKGENTPISKVVRGQGVATLFTPEGTFKQKVTYQNGKPLES
jgi:antitoxin component YwqK of YwqJK toxin-antitoxin module